MRKFGGKIYAATMRVAKKSVARREAKKLRNQGYLVRIVEEDNAFRIYTRAKLVKGLKRGKG